MIHKEPTHVEKQVLGAFRAHKPTVSVDGAEIRGDFLRGLFLGEYDEKADYRGTCLENAIISDVFNMEFCETKFPLRFLNCHFKRVIQFHQLTCPELNFAGCTLKNGLNALYAKVAGGVFMRPDRFDGGDIKEFRAEGGVCLACSDIGGQLICAGKVFKNEGEFAFIAQGAKVANDLALCGEFNGEVCLAGAEIRGQLVCTGGRFQNEGENALVAHNIKVAGDVRLGDGFYAEGTVTLLGATVEGQLNCAGGIFRNKNGKALIAQGINVAGNVFLSADASNSSNIKKFEAVGTVSLAYADIKGQFACSGGSFCNKVEEALDAQGMKVAGDVLLECGFKAEGKVSFLGADIGGQLSCRGGSFQNEGGDALVAQGIQVGSSVFLIAHEHHETKVAENFSATGRVLLDNATIGGNLTLAGCEITHMSLSSANVLGEFRDDADVYKGREGKDIVLNIDGFRYHRLNATKERVEDRLAWVGLMGGDENIYPQAFYPQPYEQLMKVYREMGHMMWARNVGFALENTRHEKMKPVWWRSWYWLLRHTIGYGYKPFMAAYWFGALILVGLMLFSGSSFRPDSCRAGSESFYCMAPSDAGVLLSDDWKVHGKLPKDYPDFNPVYYAVEAALPVLPLGQTQNWHPKTWWTGLLQGAITIIGALVLTILASFGVGVLGPRWKDE